MSFVDLATLALHRRNEMEVRISTFSAKCDQAINEIRKLKSQARTFVEQLNCDPSELKERFLTCMNQLDEYIYVMTDFNLSIAKLEEHGSVDMAPVQDHSYVAYPILTPTNLMDVLSEPTPSTSSACTNMCPVERPKRRRIPKEEQLLIEFSSSSCSAESVPEVKSSAEKEVQCVAQEIKDLTVKDPPDMAEIMNLPAQSMLQADHMYDDATIISIDESTIWVITDDTNMAYNLWMEITEYYKEHKVQLTLKEIEKLTLCIYDDIYDDGDCFYRALFIKLTEPAWLAQLTLCIYDDIYDDGDCFYRALFIKLTEDEPQQVEVFLVDTGEFRTAEPSRIQPMVPQFCAMPPQARCCHLADVDLLSCQDLLEKQKEFMEQFIGKKYSIRVDDNTSESLGIYVFIDETTTINERLVEEGLALAIDKPSGSRVAESTPAPAPRAGPPELVRAESDLGMEETPEFEDPLQAVTGYSNRDEMDICKHYKGGPEKSCFKGARCQKRHVLQHPDGWTLDRVAVPAVARALPLPPPGAWLRVLVTYVCHFDRVCVQFVQDLPKGDIPSFGVVLPPTTLEALVRDMNSPATRMAYKKLDIAPAPGELVAALYPPDDQWYRARVVACTPADQNVEVIYIDYGNVVWVKENAIRELEPRFLHLPAQAVRCRIAGVEPKSQSSKQWAAAKTVLANLTQDKTLNARVIDRDLDELTIEMFDAQGYSIAERMEACGVTALKEIEEETDFDIKFKMVQA